MPRPNPFNLSVLPSHPIGGDDVRERSEIQSIIDNGLTADSERGGWISRQRVLTRLRYSIRRPALDFPFKGCSNLGIPYIDQIIRKAKPNFMRLITDADPIVEFQGEDPDAADVERDAEEFYNWLFKLEMDSIEPLAYLIDTMCHRGFAFAQAGWDYRTEYECRTVDVASILQKAGIQPTPETSPDEIATAAIRAIIADYEIDPTSRRAARFLERAHTAISNGAPFVKIAHRKVIRDRPAVWDRDPMQVLLPVRATSVDDAEWVIVQHVLSLRRIQQLEADGFFEEGFAKKIRDDLKFADASRRGVFENAYGFTQSLQAFKELEDQRERIWGTEDDDNILLWEVFHWTDFDDDELLERAHTWIHPRSRSRGRHVPYAYPFHRWPLVKFDFEKTSRRWHSPRGISAMLEGIQREVNAQHNARIDGMTIRNAPTYQVQAAAGFKSRNWRLQPGQVLQMPPGAQIQPVAQDRGPFPEQFQEENYLRNIGEQYIGTFDAVLNNATSSEARTATEIQAAAQFAASTATFDAILFQHSMRRLHELIWALWVDLGPDEVYIKVMGENAQPAPKLIRKADISRRFKLIPTGNLINTNRALELSHAREALQIYLNDASGFINPFELRRWHFRLLDFQMARRILNSPDQARELQVLRQAASEVENNPELQAALQGGVTDVPAEEVERQRTEQEPRQPANRF